MSTIVALLSRAQIEDLLARAREVVVAGMIGQTPAELARSFWIDDLGGAAPWDLEPARAWVAGPLDRQLGGQTVGGRAVQLALAAVDRVVVAADDGPRQLGGGHGRSED